MRNQRKILVEQLDRKLRAFSGTEMVIIPDKGWINAIRTTINMTLEQLGKKLRITKQGVKRIEESEAAGTLTIKSLKEVGNALEMKFVYGFVPFDGSIDSLIDRKSKILAEKIILRTNHSMMLEDQGIEKGKLKKAIEDLSQEIKFELKKVNMGLDFKHIDGQTPLSEDEKEGLLIQTITSRSELDELEQLNIEKAIEWTMNNRFVKEKILSEGFIKSVHKKMFGDVWSWAGTFRKSEKNIGVDWIKIGVELRNLIDDTNYWIENEIYPPDEISIRFKHRLVNIHCFPNGNGRHSRIMADIIIESIFGKEIFTWNNSNLVKPDNARKEYIDAIKKADEGTIEPLLEFARK